ncbi:MAG: SPOR domain-containing protein [Ramlibacter sp.]|nr:SPOR domain-containing protein [Ramlibacter sp.]
MAFFKFRKSGDDSSAGRRPAETIEEMRRRARHRLIGAGVLVLIGVVGFPLLFDTQPRPIAVDIPIEIPDRDKAKPLGVPSQPAAQAPSASGPVTAVPAPPPQVAASPAPAAPAAVVAEVPPPAKVEAKAEPKAAAPSPPKPEAKAEPKVAAPPPPRTEEAAKAKAQPEGNTAPAAAAPEGRFVVQVGAFADPAKARAARLKVERAGLRTYTNVADTKDGKRVRVRVGPFATRAEADKAATKLKGLELPAAILAL